MIKGYLVLQTCFSTRGISFPDLGEEVEGHYFIVVTRS
jgi:hypothetical protein